MSLPLIQSIRTYTDEEIQDYIKSGYLFIHPSLYEHVPIGSTVCLIERDDSLAKDVPRGRRFTKPIIVRDHVLADGKPALSMAFTNKASVAQCKISTHENIEALWKKYDKDAYLELHLTFNSLAAKKNQLEQLDAKFNALSALVNDMNARLVRIEQLLSRPR